MKILIVKTSSLGDIIQAFPALDYLRRRFPNAQIDWLVENSFAELVRANPQVDRVLTVDTKKWRANLFKKETLNQLRSFYKPMKNTCYDLLFDLQGNLKSSALIWGAQAKIKIGFGWKTVHEWPNALFTRCRINPIPGKNIREDYLAVVQGYFGDKAPYTFHPTPLKLNPLQQQKLTELFKNGDRPTLVCPSSAWSNKCLSEDLLINFLTKFNQTPYWFIWGSEQEREKVIRLSLHFKESVILERLSLPLLQHVMARCKRVIAMDSLPLHLCTTTSTPTISFFGPSLAAKFAPIGEHHCTIQGKCPYGKQFKKTCPKLRTCKTGLCLKAVDQLDEWVEIVNRKKT